MDLLKGFELNEYKLSALHTPKGNRPASVYTSNGQSLFEDIQDRNLNLSDDFARRRMASQRQAAMGGSDVFAAIPRFYSPKEYFETQKIPYRIDNDAERFKLYQWLDLFYRTHYLIPILIDIFTRFPLVGLEFHSPDKDLTAFYEDLFFDRLDYEHFLVDLGREYWTLGQAFPLGHFNETLGVWEEEELLDPTMVKVRNYPIIGGEQFFLSADGMKRLREIVEKREPREIYYILERDYPEWIPFLRNKKDIPVSGVLLKQVAFKASSRDTYGTPILLRALRTLMHEEKLMASQDAIAERLYSPMILVKLGIQDMGQQRGPWIPGPSEVQEVRDTFDLALSSDFRLMVHHFGIEVQNVFGREQMPRLDQDFDRIERRLMQTFGINPSLLSGGSASQPYASSALQAEFLNQILRTYQKFLINHYKQRALIVAEAQNHYAYEKRGDARIPIMEEVIEIDEETGEEVVVEKHKLLVPDLRMKVLDLRDEATQRQFMQALKQQGVPIPDQDIAMGMHYDFEEALGKTEEEMIQKTVSQQEAKVKTYNILTALGYPIPADLKAEVEGAAAQGAGGTGIEINPPPAGGDIPMPPPPDMGGTPAIEPYDAERGQRPEQSDERSPIPPPGQVPNPTLPGVPGQPGMLGIPGAPKPAIGVSSEDETKPLFERVEEMLKTSADESEETVSKVIKLPRKANVEFVIPSLTDGADPAILEEDKSDDGTESPETG
jgi:hypothetical protein